VHLHTPELVVTSTG